MRTDDYRRKEIAKPTLNPYPFVCVVAIGRPNPASLFKNSEVRPPPAGRTGFDLHGRGLVAKPAKKSE